MKLVDLNPRWGNRDHVRTERVGVWFDCPGACCSGKVSMVGRGGYVPTEDEKERIWVPFANPLDGLPPVSGAPGFGWDREGETFETLTLKPSVDFKHGPGGSKGWHGFVTNGEVSTC